MKVPSHMLQSTNTLFSYFAGGFFSTISTHKIQQTQQSLRFSNCRLLTYLIYKSKWLICNVFMSFNLRWSALSHECLCRKNSPWNPVIVRSHSGLPIHANRADVNCASANGIRRLSSPIWLFLLPTSAVCHPKNAKMYHLINTPRGIRGTLFLLALKCKHLDRWCLSRARSRIASWYGLIQV